MKREVKEEEPQIRTETGDDDECWREFSPLSNEEENGGLFSEEEMELSQEEEEEYIGKGEMAPDSDCGDD